MRRRTFLAGVLAGGGASLAGCTGRAGSGGSGGSDDYDVGMSSSAFRPSELTIERGETVVWKNTNSRAHTVTAYGDRLPDGAAYFASGGFDSEAAARRGYRNGLEGSLYTGETFEQTFEVPGRYDYFCVPHERGGMVGTVVVRE